MDQSHLGHFNDSCWLPEPNTGCWLWLKAIDKGYPVTSVRHRKAAAHRVAYELAHGEIGAGLVVRHRCDVPSCVNPAHLCVGTQADNIADKVAKRRQARGERQAGALLTADAVRQIRAEFKGWSRTSGAVALAERFGVAPRTILSVIHRETWTHV